MISVAFALLLAGGLEPETVSESRADREIQQALRAEARGDLATRAEFLVKATLANRDHATARGLLGQMRSQGAWQSIDAVEAAARDDSKNARLIETYRAHRAGTRWTSDAQTKLADWCRENGLPEEERAHLFAITRLGGDADRVADAWKRLGYRRHGNRWMTENEISDEARENAAQQEADRKYVPLLKRLRANLAERKRRDAAEQALAGLTDPRAVPAVWAVFANGSQRDQSIAAQLLGQIDATSATQVLATIAVRSSHPDVRSTATQILSHRDPRAILAWLIPLVQPRVAYDVRPGSEPATPYELVVKQDDQTVRRSYLALPQLVPGTNFRGFIGVGADGLPIAVSGRKLRQFQNSPNQMSLQAVLDDIDSNRMKYLRALGEAAAMANKRLSDDVASLESYNAGALASNEWHVLPVLRAVTGQDFGEDREAWTKWWVDQLGYQYKKEAAADGQETRPKVVRQSVFTGPSIPIYSCFAAGTLVHTREGHRAIESLELGDVVLALDTRTGALSHEPIVSVHHNPPGSVVELDLGAETIAATGYHRFWKPGAGWAMARTLRAGDTIRTLRGPRTIKSIADGPVQPVYNLDVASGRTFFVGHSDALVHDNSLPDDSLAVFDAIAPANP
jgi:hypothetical protein